MKTARTLLAAAAMMIAPAITSTASAQNLVTNGGFETGNFAGFTRIGFDQTDVLVSDGNSGLPIHTGTYAAAFGSIGGLGGISQTLNTTAGSLYTFSFYFASDGQSPNEFQAYFGGTQVFEALNVPFSSYTLKSFNVLATSPTTTISFLGRNDIGLQALDDVSVTAFGAVPEPATWGMMILGMGAVGFAMRRRQQRAIVSFA